MAIIFNGFATERFQAGARSEAGGWLVETDVSIPADAKNLQIDPARSHDGLLISRTVGAVIAGDSAIGNVDLLAGKISVGKKIVLHEVMETVGMRRREAKIFIEIETGGARKIERAGAMKGDQFLVQAERGIARRETENNFRFGANCSGNDTSGLGADFLVIFFYDYQHLRPFRE